MGLKWKPKVVIIDDDPYVLEVFRIAMKRVELDATVFPAGAEALEFIGSAEDRYPPCDMVFCDLMMPSMKGSEVVRRIKRSYPQIPIVIITGYPESDEMKRVAELGYVGLLLKPIDFPQLLRVLDSHGFGLIAPKIDDTLQNPTRSHP